MHVPAAPRRVLALLVLLVLPLHACGSGDGKGGLPFNFAAAFRWQSGVDTDLAFGEFFEADHTIAARFMMQYPTAYAGPIVSNQGLGRFFLGQGDYRDGEHDPDTGLGKRNLMLEVGDVRAIYTLGDELEEGVWHHVAMTRAGGNYDLYLNGIRLCRDRGPNDIFCSIMGGFNLPDKASTLRIGTQSDDWTVNDRQSQFYGLVDDVAVFGRVLSEQEIAALADTPRLTGTESGLIAGYTFDSFGPAGKPLPATLSRPYQFVNKADPSLEPGFKLPVSESREDAVDAESLPKPTHLVARRLPFEPGVTYKVTFGISTEDSTHNGSANFAWDFALANGSASCGEPILSSADGTIPEFHMNGSRNIVDDGPTDALNCGAPLDGHDYIRVLEAPGQMAAYLHTQIGSITDAMDELGQSLYPFGVQAGDRIARIGTRCANNCHLHIAVSSPAARVTYPAAYVDYDVSEDGGQTWTYVASGIPQTGQWARAR